MRCREGDKKLLCSYGNSSGRGPGRPARRGCGANESARSFHPVSKSIRRRDDGYALEAQTTRLTTKFKDGHAAVAERGLVGDVRTTLRDEAGNERARLRLNRIDGTHDMVNYEPIAGAPFQALSDPNVAKPTLDWATRQAYGLAKDGTTTVGCRHDAAEGWRGATWTGSRSWKLSGNGLIAR